MQFLTIFFGGFISFFSPCILPVIPLYIGYLSGNDLNNRKRIIINTIFFALGVSFVFVILALGFSTLGRMIQKYRESFSRYSGIPIILLGLFQLGILKSRFLSSEKKFEISVKKMNGFIAFLLGFTFSFAWTPCVGPTLFGVLLVVSNSADRIKGITLMGVYTLGFILPFLITGIFSSYILKAFKRNMYLTKYVPYIMGTLLIILGVLVYTRKLNILLEF